MAVVLNIEWEELPQWRQAMDEKLPGVAVHLWPGHCQRKIS